jgi:hypothetical protein
MKGSEKVRAALFICPILCLGDDTLVFVFYSIPGDSSIKLLLLLLQLVLKT